jgi:hypothetical protein
MILIDSEFERFFLMPLGGLLGGLSGGLLAGIFTMLALRHHAGSIGWKHMSASIRIWGIVGPLGSIVAGAIPFVVVNFEDFYQDVDCAVLNIGECIGQSMAAALGAAVIGVIVLVLLVILYVLVALFLIGVVAGVLVVRHIRRLEPGILGRQAIWVVLSWGAGAVLAIIVSLLVSSALEGL